jgi:hypothetical protein
VSATNLRLPGRYTDANLFETVSLIRGDELDDAGTYELVHKEATPDELKQLPIWDHLPQMDRWLASE